MLASDVLDFEKDLEVMTTMHSYNMYPPRFTIEVDGQRATASSLVEVEFTGVNRDLSTEVILPLPIQQPVLQKISGIVLYLHNNTLVCFCIYVALVSMHNGITDLGVAVFVIHEFHCVSICLQFPLFHGCLSGELKEAGCADG